MTLDTLKSPMEWAVAYHVITGACEAGCRNFLDVKGKVKKQYTLAEILEETKGAYGHDTFSKFVEELK